MVCIQVPHRWNGLGNEVVANKAAMTTTHFLQNPAQQVKHAVRKKRANCRDERRFGGGCHDVSGLLFRLEQILDSAHHASSLPATKSTKAPTVAKGTSPISSSSTAKPNRSSRLVMRATTAMESSRIAPSSGVSEVKPAARPLRTKNFVKQESTSILDVQSMLLS